MIFLTRSRVLIVRLVFLVAFIAQMVGITAGTGFCQKVGPDDVPEIVFRKDAKLGAVYRKNNLNLYLKLVRLYSEKTKDPVSLQQSVKQYLISSISNATEQMHREDKAWKTQSELVTMGKTVLDAGCEDPLVLLFHARVLTLQKHDWGRNVGLGKGNKPVGFHPNEDPVPVAKRALKALGKSAYPKGIKILFLGALNNALDREKIRDQVKQRISDDLKVVNAIPAWVAFVKGAPDWERIAYSVIQRHPIESRNYRKFGYASKRTGKEQLVLINKFGKQKKLSAWLYQMMLADHYNSFPQSGRIASKYYRSESNFEALHAGISEEAKEAKRLAAKHYRAAYEINSSRPEPAAILVMLAYEGYDDEERFTWFQRAIDTEIDYPDAYYYFLFTSKQLPAEAIVKLAYQFYESDRFDTAIPLYFSECLCKMLPWEYQGWMSRDDKLFETTRDLFVKYAEHDGASVEDSIPTQRQISILRYIVRISVEARRFDIAFKYSQLLDQMSPDWMARTKDKVFIRSMLHARNNYPDELRGIIFDFEEHRGATRPNGDLAEIANRYDALAANCDPISAPYLKMCSILVGKLWDYDNGDWVELGGEFPADHLWGATGNFRCHADGSIDVTNSPKMRPIDDFFELSYQGRFEFPREIQCEMNLLNWNGRPECGFQNAGVCAFRLQPQHGVAGVEGRRDGIAYRRNVIIPGLRPDEPVALKLRIWDKANFQFFVNGVLVDVGDLELEKATNSLTFTGRTDLYKKKGAETPSRPEIAVRLSNVRVRKLDFAPPPKRSQPKEGLDYFSTAITREPEIASNYLRRADCHAQLNNIEEALSDYRRGLKGDPRITCEKLRFVQLCLSSGEYREAHEILYEYLGKLRAAKKVIDVAKLGKIAGKKKSWSRKQQDKVLVRKTLAILGFEPKQKLEAMIANFEAQLLLLQGTCPDDKIRSTKISKALLMSTRSKNKASTAFRFLGRAYVEAEMKQYAKATKSLEVAKKAAGDSDELLAQIASAENAVENRMPIRLEGEQMVVLKSTIQ